jgi:DNA-binding CsgD family transcriptional regulator
MSLLEAVACAKGGMLPAAYDEELPHGLVAALADEVECGLIACDGTGRLWYANRSAREELAAARALKIVAGSIRCAAGPEAGFEGALFAAAHHNRRQLLALGQPGEQLMASLVPLRGAGRTGSLVLIVLGRRGPCSELGLEMLARMHGLTLAERRVLGLLLAQETPRTIAAIHGVALSTVRSQVKSIRDKFGVRSIEALLIRAAEVPPVATAWRRLGGSVWPGSAGPHADAQAQARVLAAAA